MNKEIIIIALDGPSGSGKSTIAKLLAQKLNITYVDTGAMFRAIGLNFYENDFIVKENETFELNDNNSFKEYLKNIKFKYENLANNVLIQINNKNYSSNIRENYVSSLASIVAQNNEVRQFLKEFQQKLGQTQNLVMDGRDIGTVIFPKANFKFFITASSKERAQRRFDQLNSQNKLGDLTLSEIEKDIIERDNRDMNRAIAPLKQASDAILIDTSKMNIEEVILTLFNKIKS